jgi:hypothetical protein
MHVYHGHPNGEEIAGGQATFPLFALDPPGVTPIALSIAATSDGVSLMGDQVAMTQIATDRLEPETG